MKIHEAAENYLETIYILSKTNPNVRAIDICTHLGYSRPTVSVALKQLKQDNFIDVDGNNYITLTNSGLNVALSMYDRHETIAQMLMQLGVNENTAYEDSCKIEHVISQESFKAIKDHFQAFKNKNSTSSEN